MTEPIVGYLSDRGLHPDRPVNEDAFFVPAGLEPGRVAQRGWLYVVSDGMGGEAAGEVASRLGVDTFKEYYYREQGAGSPGQMLAQAAQVASSAVLAASGQPGRKSMGATFTALVLHEDRAYVLNLGDSRCYLVRDGAITQLTEDHTFVARMVRKGLMTPEEARSSPKRNIISRYMGMENPRPDLFENELRGGDIFLLATDGVHGVLSDEELREMVLQHPPDRAAIGIIEKVKSRGAPDNATVVVVKVAEVEGKASGAQQQLRGQSLGRRGGTKPARARRVGLGRALALMGLMVLVLLMAFALRKYLRSASHKSPASAAVDADTTKATQPESESGETAAPESMDSSLPRDTGRLRQPGKPHDSFPAANDHGSI